MRLAETVSAKTHSVCFRQIPNVQVMDTRGPAFKALVDAAKAARGASFDVCDVDIPAKVG